MVKLLKNIRERKMKLTSIIIAIVLVASSVIYALASQKVTMSVTQVPNIDVVLTKSKTDVDLTNFENDLLDSLEKKGITKDKVKISAVEAQSEVTTESFTWKKDVSPNIGTITITDGGKNVSMTGNNRLAGKNAIWIMPTGNQEQEFNFGYNINFGDSFNAAGMLLRVQETGSTLKGYMLSFNYNTWKNAAGGYNGAIWEFTYSLNNNTTNVTKTLKKGLNINTTGTLNVKVTDKEIIISGGGLSSPVTYELENSFGAGYGFFSDHYSHGCNSIGSFTLSNINLKTVTVKDFNEVLRAPDWRDGACKVLVNVSDVTNDQFGDNNQLTEIISRLMNDDIHYIGWGTDTNKEEMENTIATNDGKGLYLDNSDYTADIEATAKYIKESLAGIADSKYIIANEPVVIKINPSLASTNTADSNYPNGKWKVEHDYTAFENNEGQYAKSGIYTEDVIDSFPKPGSYKVYYEDELITEIFAHRRPVASFDMQKNGSSLTLSSTSYDLDEQSNNNGIQEEEWSYKKMGTNVWNTGKLTTLDSNSTYIVKLRVKDFQDAWSTAATKYVTSDNVTLNPVAQYKITNKTISLYKELEVIDSSYDPAGLDLTSYTWTVKKNDIQVYQGATPLLDYKTLGAGTYTMSLVVKNSSNKVSEEFAQTYTITPDTTAPEFIADITEATVVNSSVDVNLTFTDKESGFKSYKYAITETKDEPTSWTTVNAPTAGVPSFDTKVTISGCGKWYLHIKGTDKDGNESEDRVLGIYNIQKGYTIEIQTVDSNTGVGLIGAKIQLSGEYRDGKEISLDASLKTTDNNGKIKITDVPLLELSTIKISNPIALAGYEKNDMKILTTDTSIDKIVVSENLTSKDLKTTVSSDGETVLVKVPLTKKKFNLKITTLDESNTSIKLSGSKYILKYRGTKVAESTESADGVVTLESPIGLATGVADDFKLEQITAANGYTATSATTLSVTFAGDGSFISMRQTDNSQVTIPDPSDTQLIVRNSRGAEGTFAINMNITDQSNVLTKIQGSKYKVKVETDTGLSYVTDAQTSNANGNIVFNNLFGLGIIKLTFIHEGAPTGYAITTSDRYITIENNNGTITYNPSSISGVFNKIENKVVYVNLKNAKKTSTDSIQIRVYDAQNSDVGVEGINFEIYKLIGGTKVGSGTTDENGILIIDGLKSDGEGDVIYKIVPINQTSTNIQEAILIAIHFGKNGYSTGAYPPSSQTGVDVVWEEDDSGNLFRRLTKVNIAVSVKQTLGETKLTINKREAETNYPIEGSSYKIRMRNNDDGSMYTNTYTTDANGQFTLSVPDATSITIKITEVKAAPGYTLDGTTKELTLVLNSEGNLIPEERTFVNLESGNVSVDNNNININIKEEGVSLKYPKIKFKITKTDMSASAMLPGVSFKITDMNTNDFKQVTTNPEGYIETSEWVIRDSISHTFTIEETNPYPGYELPAQPFIIRFSFLEVDNIIKFTAENYLQGDELLGNKKTTYNAETNEVTVELTIKNNEDKSVDLSTYGIDIEKVDSEGNPVTGSRYKIEVRPYGAMSATYAKEIDSSIEVPMVPLTEQQTTILLTETQEAIGFSKDQQMKVVTVVQGTDGTVSWDPNSSSSDLQISTKDVTQDDGTTKKVLVIRIVAKAPEEIHPSDPTIPSADLLRVETENTDETGTLQKNTAYMINDTTYQVEVLDTYMDTLVRIIPKDSDAKVTIDAEAEVQGTATKTVDLLSTTTIVTIKVTNSDGTQDKIYTLNIIKSENNTGSISADLEIQEVDVIDEGNIVPAYQTSSIVYEVSVLETATETDLTVITKDATAKVSIEGDSATVNTQTKKITLTDVSTTVNVQIQNADGTETKDYIVVIKRDRPDSNSNNLNLLKVETENTYSTGTVQTNTAYRINDTTYQVEVLNTYTDTLVRITPEDSNAKVTIDTEAEVTGIATKTVDLVAATTTVTIKVTNSDGTQDKTYTLNIIKSESNTGSISADLQIKEVNVIDEGNTVTAYQTSSTEYEVSVLETATETDLTVITNDATAKVSIEGDSATVNTQTKKITLTDVSTTVNVQIQNADGTETKDYTVVIKRDRPDSGSSSENPEDDPNATVVFRIFNKTLGTWNRSYRSVISQWVVTYCPNHPNGHGYWINNTSTSTCTLSGEQRLPIFFKDTYYSDNNKYNFGFTTGETYIVVEARLIENGVVSSDIYESQIAITNSAGVDKAKKGTNTVNFQKDYKGKEVEFTIIQKAPAYNHKRIENEKITIKFDADGNVESGIAGGSQDLESVAVAGISASGTLTSNNMKYPTYDYNGTKTYTEPLEDITEYDCKGTNTINVGILNQDIKRDGINTPLDITLNIKDSDTLDLLGSGSATVVISEVDTNNNNNIINSVEGTKTIDITDGTGKVRLDNIYTSRTLILSIIQGNIGNYGAKQYNAISDTIQIQIEFDDDGNIKSYKELNTPNKVTLNNVLGTNLEYTIYNDCKFNFQIDITKLDENGKPLEGTRFEAIARIITDADTSASTQVDIATSKITSSDGQATLKFFLPETGTNAYPGRTFDITIRETYVPDNYLAYKDVKVRVLFNSKGKIQEAPQLISEPESNIVNLSKNFTNAPMAINMSIQNKQLAEHPIFEIKNVNSVDENVYVDGTQYKVTTWDAEEYENAHLTYKEQTYSIVSNSDDGMSTAYMSKSHALRTIVYTFEEIKTSNSYQTNRDIIIKVKYDEEGKIVSRPEILSTQYIRGEDVVKIEGNPIGSTMIALKVIHELKPKFTINIDKYDTKRRDFITRDVVFKGTSQVKQSDGTYGPEEESIISIQDDSERITIGFKEDHKRDTILYTIYETTGNTLTKRGQVEVEFDAYGNVANARIVDETNPKNYLKARALNTNNTYISVRVEVEEFRMKINLKSSDPTSIFELNGATFDIQNEYEQINNVNLATNRSGIVEEIIGEVYRGEEITYTIKQIKAPENYDLINDITFTIKFNGDGTIAQCNPSSIPDEMTVINTIKDENGNNIEIELYADPSAREIIKINDKLENSNTDIPSARYEITALITEPRVSTYPLILDNGTGTVDLGPDKKFFGKSAITYTIKQTEVAEGYMRYDKDIKVTVNYRVDGTIENIQLLSPTDGSVKITNPEDGTSTTGMLQNVGGNTIQIDMVNKRKAIMQVENQNIENASEKLSNSTFRIIEQDKPAADYSDTKTTGANGIANMNVGPLYKSEHTNSYVEKTYVISNTIASFGFSKIDNATFTLQYDNNGNIIGGNVSSEAQNYLEIELIPSTSSLYGTADVRIIVKSKPNLTIGIEAISKTTKTSITGMRYEIRQVSPTAGRDQPVVTDSGYIAHADMGATPTDSNVPSIYEIVEKQVAGGYKYIGKDTVIARFEIEFDADGYIKNNSNSQRINITSGNEYVELNSSVDRTLHYDIDIKINYEESEEFTLKIKNVNAQNNADYIISDFTASISSSSATGTTDSNGNLTLNLGKRTANERRRVIITQSNVQGSYAQVNTIAIDIECNEDGKILRATPVSGGSYATENIGYKILQPSGTATYVMEIEVYNNPQTTIKIVHVDQSSEQAIKQPTKFILNGTMGITSPITLTTDINDGTASTPLDSVPKRNRVIYTITEDTSSIPAGYEQLKMIGFAVEYSEDGLVTNITPSTGINYADNTTVEFTKLDNYTILVKIKSKSIFEIYVETEDAYDDSIKLGANVTIKEDRTTKAFTTQAGVGVARSEFGTNIANSGYTYEVNIGTPTTPSNITQTYYRNAPSPISIRVTFGSAGEINSLQYENSPYIDPAGNCIIETERAGTLGIKIKIKYIPNLTVNVKRIDSSSGNGMSGKRIELSSTRMKDSPRASTTNSLGEVTFDGGRIADDDGTEVVYRISETNSTTDYNYQALPSDMQVWVTYNDKGNINDYRTNYPGFITMTGKGTRTLNVEIKSVKKVRIILHNTDYYLNTNRISGIYEISSSKGFKSIQIVTQESSSTTSSSTMGTPIDLGEAYAGEDVVYTIHNIRAKEGYEVLDDMQFTVHYGTDGRISVDTSKFTNSDRLELITPINQTTSERTANITLNIKSKPLLMVRIHATDKTYDQPIEKLGFEITDPTGFVNRVEALTDSNGFVTIPIKTAEENKVVHYTIRQVATNGGYAMTSPLTLIVKYGAAGTIDESGTYVANTNIASIRPNYSEEQYSASKIRTIQVNIKLETKLGIGIYKIDGDTGEPLQGVGFKITEEELIGGNAVNSWNDATNQFGEMTAYTRSLGGNVQKVKYTITETEPQYGYRPIGDIVIEVTFASDKSVQSVVVKDKPDGVTVETVDNFLKMMEESRELEYIKITIKNDNKVKFKIVNLDRGFKDSAIDVPIVGSEFDITVARDGTVVNRYETISNTQLVTNANGEAVISIEGPGLLEIDYEQKKVGAGYKKDITNTGFIKITKAANEYKITYNDSTDNIKYKIDEITGEVIIYIYNENQLKFNINNVDMDDNSIPALNAEQKIKAYYGEITDDVQTILSQTTNVVEYNNNNVYSNPTGSLEIDLGNTYTFINKKVVFKIDTETTATGYTPIGEVYVVVEFDKFGKIVQVTNEAQSERLMNQNKEDNYQFIAAIGFGNLNKWHIKIVKETNLRNRIIEPTEFRLQTYVDNVQTDLGIPVDPSTSTIRTGDILIDGIIVEQGAFEYRGIQTTGNIKIELEETQAAPGYDNNIGIAEITFDVTTDTTDPLEPRPVISNEQSNNSSVKVTANASTRELEILVINEPKATIELYKVDEEGAGIGNVKFNATIEVEGDPSTRTYIEKDSSKDLYTDNDETPGKLEFAFPTTYANQNMLLTITEGQITGYKQAQTIKMRIHTDENGKIDPYNVRIISGENLDDGKGGAKLNEINDSKISLEVVNVLQEGYKPFKLKIIKENAVNSSIKIPNVQFQIKVTPDVGAAIYKVQSTDETGTLEIPKVTGEGKIKVELIELIAPNGYKLGSTNGYFTFTVNKTENGITKVSSTLGNNASNEDNIQIDSENKIVEAHVPNELDKIGISIHKVDAMNGSNIKGATFELVDESIGDPDHYPLVTTNSQGIAYFAVDKKDRAGEYTYTLTETGTPQGYKTIEESMTIKVEYDSNGNIVDIEESGDSILLTEQKDKAMTLQVSNIQKPLEVPLYTLEIKNTDKANSSIVIPKASFNINITQAFGSSQITQSIATDNNGIATIENINGSGNIDIEITEIQPGDGYKKDTNSKKVRLSRDSYTGKFTILGSTNAYPVYDEANNKIIIYISNEKEKGIYSLIVNKIDENGNKIAVKDTEFDVTVQENTLQLKTDEFGQAIVNKLSIPDGTDFDISIKETKEPTGYNKVTDAQVINATVQTIYEEKVLKNVTVKSGDAIAVINSNESMIEINFTNQSIDNESLYLTSDVYTVNDYVERVPAWTSIADYLTNMKSNGTMTVYDKNGNEITDTTKYVGTGMVIKATKGNEEITKTIIVIGDVTGNGEIKLLDVSKVNQHFVGKSQLDGIYIKAADMNGDGKIKLLDVSKINQAYVNH